VSNSISALLLRNLSDVFGEKVECSVKAVELKSLAAAAKASELRTSRSGAKVFLKDLNLEAENGGDDETRTRDHCRDSPENRVAGKGVA